MLIVCTALFVYEYCITFSEEVRCIWLRKLSGGSAIFFINRYAILFERAARMVQLVDWAHTPENQADEMSIALINHAPSTETLRRCTCPHLLKNKGNLMDFLQMLSIVEAHRRVWYHHVSHGRWCVTAKLSCRTIS